MSELLFKIPRSLATYVEQFEENPSKITAKLKNHLNKRGPDAVGFFLLALLYHKQGNQKQAIRYALYAKTFAPGSPLMEKLHYYLSHPGLFEAWAPPDSSDEPPRKHRSGKNHDPFFDLDHLILQLSNLESNRITPSDNNNELVRVEPDSVEHDVDDIASETLASIHEKQGKTEAAIRTYKKLKKLNKEKKDFYMEQISRLKQLRGEQLDDDNDDED